MAVQVRTVQAAISENRTWFIILGVLLIILGIAAISFPLLTTIAAKIFLGWLFVIGGIVQINLPGRVLAPLGRKTAFVDSCTLKAKKRRATSGIRSQW